MPSVETSTPETYRAAALAVLTYLLAVAGVVGVGMWQIDWQLVYPLDDTYIHLSTARTLAEHGTWSAIPTEPGSPSSSVLWTLVLAGAGALGLLGEWAPIVINVLLGVATILFSDRILRRRFPDLGERQRFGLLSVLVLVSSISVQTVVGMEHTLQILVALLFLETAVGTLLERTSPEHEHNHALPPAAIWILAPLLVAVRFEAAFLVLPVCIVLAWYRRIGEGFLLGLASMVPVAAFAAYSLEIGNYPLPNSILLKTDALGIAEGASVHKNILINLLSSPLPVIAMLLAIWVLSTGRFDRLLGREATSKTMLGAAIIGLATGLQLTLATTGWLFRYEAYLLAATFIFLGPYVLLTLEDELEGEVSPRIVTLGKWLVLGTLVTRALLSHVDTVRAMKDRYLEHVLPVEFITEYFPGSTVMVNDLGLPAWHHDGEVLDMFGLGSNKPIDMRLSEDGYTRADVREWAEREDVTLAIHQVQWPFVAEHIPKEWEVVGFWKVPRNVVFQDKIVGFFAVDKEASADVHRHLRTFVDERVPASVKTKFYAPGETYFEEFAKEMGKGNRIRR